MKRRGSKAGARQGEEPQKDCRMTLRVQEQAISNVYLGLSDVRRGVESRVWGCVCAILGVVKCTADVTQVLDQHGKEKEKAENGNRAGCVVARRTPYCDVYVGGA